MTNINSHKTKLLSIVLGLSTAITLGACDDPPPAMPDSGGGGTDSGMTDGGGMPTDGGMTDGGGGGATCADYCTAVTANCTGGNAQYTSMAECMTYCNGAGWPAGADGATSGNSIACRIYHGGVPAMGEPVTHCPHAGPSGGGVCGTVTFSAATPAMFTRVDRMGMPAVSTVLITAANKNAYNDASLAMDGMSPFVDDIVATIGVLHTNLDDDLTTATLVPCTTGGTGSCVAQGAPLIIPDALTIDTSMAAGFPNGRLLADPVIDVTLAVLLLDLSAPGQTALSLVGTNPPANDVAEGVFPTTFPYLHPPHAP